MPRMADAADTLAEGAIIGRFRLEHVVGEGGMGVVWAAREVDSERTVALKFLREVRKSEPTSHARFLREAEAAMTVRHPHVAPIRSIEYTDAGTPYLVMDLLEGESLRERLRYGPPLGLRECAQILGPVVAAVRAAHASGIVHRDLKPENVFLATQGVQVLDFGIAKRLSEDEVKETFTSTGAMLGTPGYMAPEQIFGERDIDGRVDVWALGVILYECLAGVRPAEGGVGQILKIVTSGTFVPLAERVKDPEAAPLCRFVMRMLSREPRDRPSLDRLAKLLAEHSAEAGDARSNPTDAPTVDTLPRPTRSRAPAVVALVAVVAAASIGAFALRHAFATSSPMVTASASGTNDPTASVPPSSWVAPLAASTGTEPAASIVPTAASLALATASPTHSRIVVTMHPSTTASASATPFTREFVIWPGVHGGIGETTTIQALNATGNAMKPCFPAPTPTEQWSARIVYEWPKGAPRVRQVKGLRNDVDDDSSIGAQIVTCVTAILDGAKIPDAIGQDDIGGKPAYASLRVGYTPFK